MARAGIPKAAVLAYAVYPRTPVSREAREQIARAERALDLAVQAVNPEPPRLTPEGTVRPLYTCDPLDPLSERPCPWSGCRYVLPAGGCAVDVADDGAHTLTEVGVQLEIARCDAAVAQRRGAHKMRAMTLKKLRG